MTDYNTKIKENRRKSIAVDLIDLGGFASSPGPKDDFGGLEGRVASRLKICSPPW